MAATKVETMKTRKAPQDDFREARAHAAAMAATHPFAVSASFDASSRKVLINFNNGAEFAFLADQAQGLSSASAEDLSEIEITPSGLGLHWEKLDADLSIPGLMNWVFGSKSWMAELGKKGGKSKSEAKTKASQTNGKKGGRPKKQREPVSC